MVDSVICALVLITYTGVVLAGTKIATMIDNKREEDTDKED